MIPSCNLLRLGRNLEALCTASTRAEGVVSSPFSNQVAPASSFRGRVWRKIGRITSSNNSTQARQSRILDTIRDQFCLAITAIAEIDSQYRLKVVSSVHSKELDRLNDQIVRIGRQLNVLFSPISSIPVKDRLEMIDVVYRASTSKSFFTDDQGVIIHRMSLDHAFCLVQLRIGRPYPFNVFSKILKREELNRNDKSVLDEWVARVQRPSAYISVGLLHAAIRCCVEILETDLSPESEEFLNKLSFLEWYIITGKATLLEEHDSHHMMWVKSLIPYESVLHTANAQITVGEQVHIESEGLTFFKQKDCPERLIVCGKNTAHVGVWRSICTHFAWSIEPVSCVFQDPSGRFCVIEKIDTTLDEISWESSNTAIAEKDKKILNELATLLEYWAMHVDVPDDISCKDIFIKWQGDDVVLKVVKPMLLTEKTSADYNRLEEFCRIFAKGNLAVYKYLMTKSRLVEHPVALAYTKAALKMLTAQQGDKIESVLALCGISDPLVLIQAEKYVQALKNARDILFIRVCSRLKYSESEILHIIAKKLVQVHKESGFFSVVHPHLTSRQMMQDLEKDIIHKQPEQLVSGFVV